MSQLRAVTKSKKPPAHIPCPVCHGAHVARDVVTVGRNGIASEGIAIVHVDCDTCQNTGKVKPAMTGCPCCCGPKDARCANCAKAGRGGSELHVCLIPTAEEINYETALAFE